MPSTSTILSLDLTPFEYFTDASNIINNKADLVLIVGEKKFYCHRLLLSLVSPVFTRMFDGEFQEHEQQEIVLHGKNSESILELLKNIYPQFDGEINDNNVEDFLELADEYMIEHLKKPCQELLEKQLHNFKFVLLPVQFKHEKPKEQTRTVDEPSSARRRLAVSKPVASTPKTNPVATNSNNLIGFLDRTQLPNFFDATNQQVPFTMVETELWLRRLRILYRIHRGKNYDDIIDSIVSVLQFVPTNILYPLLKSTGNNSSSDETLLNDLSRARMLMLEDWASDGEKHRSVEIKHIEKLIY